MELTEDQITEKYAKQCGNCSQNTSIPYEYEFTCTSCGNNLIKRKRELSKISRRKINFINRLKYAESKKLCICMDVYILYKGNDFNKIDEALSTLKNKKLKNKQYLN